MDIPAPILVSANAMRKKSGGFRVPAPDLFNGADVALDSAGFVAMSRYGGFPWTVEQYVDLAASYPWAWWASMDYCCEPEIASDTDEVRRRQQLTADMLVRCREVAGARGVKPPMPVLQGWQPSDYLRCAEMIGDLPQLVGVGSVCRRNVGGSNGLGAVISLLHSSLPPHVKLHLFGVKGTVVESLAHHPRVASTDSMAWDFACRRGRGDAPYSIETRIVWMKSWYRRHMDMCREPIQQAVFA